MQQSILANLPNPSSLPRSSEGFDPMMPPSVTPAPTSPVPVTDSQVITSPQPSVIPVSRVQPTVPNLDDEDWLQQLVGGSLSTPPTGTPNLPVGGVTSPGLPSFNEPNVEFIPSTEGLPNVDQTIPPIQQPPSEMSEVMKVLNELQAKKAEDEQGVQFQKQVDEQMQALTAKFGTADPKLLEEFSDIFSSFRAQLGTEFAGQNVRDNLELKQQLAQMKSQIEQLGKANTSTQKAAANVQDTTVYRNTIAQAIPDYTNIINSGYFTQLMATPVDAHNPDYTYNHKLGNMYKGQQTQDIISFFSDVGIKLKPTGVQNSNVVIDSGTPTSGNVATDSLTTEKLQSIYSQVMNGELQVSEADLLRLRQMAAKQAMK